MEEIRKLRKYISKGCFLDILVGCSLERNENLYKWFRKVVYRNRLFVVLAVVLFIIYFYVWNEKRLNGSDVVILLIDCLIE